MTTVAETQQNTLVDTQKQLKKLLAAEFYPLWEKYGGSKVLIDSLKQKSRDLDKYQIAVIGKPGWGKSTFLNALMGKELLPSAHVGDTTGVITYIAHQEEETNIKVHYRSQKSRTVDATQKNCLEPYINHSKNRGIGVKHIDIKTPVLFMNGNEVGEQLQKEVVFLDTPGEGSEQNKEFSEVAYQKMQESDAVIVFIRYQRIETNDANLLRGLQKMRAAEGAKFDEKLFIVANQIDVDGTYMRTGNFKQQQKRLFKLYKDIFSGIKEEQVIGISALHALNCRLLSQALDKSIANITLTDLEAFIKKQESSDRKRWRDMRTALEGLADVNKNDAPTLVLYRRSRISSMEKALANYLKGAATKSGPTHQLIEETRAALTELTANLTQYIEEHENKLTVAKSKQKAEVETIIANNEKRKAYFQQLRGAKEAEFVKVQNHIEQKIAAQIGGVKLAFYAQNNQKVEGDFSRSSDTSLSLLKEHHETILKEIKANWEQELITFAGWEKQFRTALKKEFLKYTTDEKNNYPHQIVQLGAFNDALVCDYTIDTRLAKERVTYYRDITESAFTPLSTAIPIYLQRMNDYKNELSELLTNTHHSLFDYYDDYIDTINEEFDRNKDYFQKVVDGQAEYYTPEMLVVEDNIRFIQKDMEKVRRIQEQLKELLV